jgi:hypothetical protein
MSITTSNPFAPLADYEEDNNKMDDSSPPSENVEGWANDLTVSSNGSKPVSTLTELQDKKPSAKKTQLKAKRKQKQIKIKIPKTAPINVGPKGCEKEIALLGKLSTPSSLQHAAIGLGFPAKYFGSSSTIVPYGHGGGIPRSPFIDTVINSQITPPPPVQITTLPSYGTPSLTKLSPNTTRVTKTNSPSKPLSQPSTSTMTSSAPPKIHTNVSTQPVVCTPLGPLPYLGQQPTPDRPSTPQKIPFVPTIVAASHTPALSHSSRTLFTYHAQLTFGLSVATEVNVADFFLSWVQQSKIDLPDFVLLPFSNEMNNTPAPANDIKHDDITFFRLTIQIIVSFIMEI